MAKDPICGMTVNEASALRAERDGQTFYFCSEHCRKKFLSTPATTKHEEKTEQKPQGKTILATLKPTTLLAMFNTPQLKGVAQEVENTIVKIMQEAASG